MFLKFDTAKAIQAVGVLLRREHGKRISRLRLLKLLIIADRKGIQEMGRPILGSKIVALKNGPLHNDVYNLIKGEHIDAPEWSRHFDKDGPRDVTMTVEPGVGLLSRAEIDLLNHVSDSHAQIDDDALSELTHEFPEWKSHFRENTSTPIPLEAIIDGVGRSQDKQEILQDWQDDSEIDGFFASLGN